ncbi:FecCD family ABC transporter permease [Haemophilus sp.]|uniref:FecCD family ABC transporter permease n=1 Tax=Haemophilus sp. TaxID=740 RepID=UPI003AB51E65
MTKTLKLNTALFFALLLISGFAIYHQLGDFAHLKNADGVLTDMRSMVLWDIRFPRIGLALLTGASLAIAGNAMQGIFQNPLASPGLLGSSSGATAASVFILYYFAVPFSLLLAGGVIGALLSFLIVYLIAKNYGTTMMILSGLAVNMLLGSAIALLLSNAESPWALAELYRWLQGSLMWAKLDTLLISLPIVLVGIFCLYHTRRYLDLLTFGVALLVGATIPQTGTIGFIGLIAPHFARILLKARPSQLYLTSSLIGALLLLMADLAILYIPLFSHIYIGTLTALIGAPCLIWMLLTQQRKIYD